VGNLEPQHERVKRRVLALQKDQGPPPSTRFPSAIADSREELKFLGHSIRQELHLHQYRATGEEWERGVVHADLPTRHCDRIPGEEREAAHRARARAKARQSQQQQQRDVAAAATAMPTVSGAVKDATIENQFHDALMRCCSG
jgi:hypothetical protein